MKDGAAIPELLVRQGQSSVYMEDSLRRMAAMGLDALVEIGPGKALSGFVKKTVPELPVYAVDCLLLRQQQPLLSGPDPR